MESLRPCYGGYAQWSEAGEMTLENLPVTEDSGVKPIGARLMREVEKVCDRAARKQALYGMKVKRAIVLVADSVYVLPV